MNRIIIVDDETDLFPVFKIKFRREIDSGNIQMNFFTSGPEIIQFLDTNPDLDIKLILLDLFLPGMNGIEILKTLKEKRPHLKVIMYSAHTDDDIEKEALGAGADKFLHKPLNFQEMKKYVAA
ncbi:MAG: response regulator [Epsilonproteobacteria bacterium]|nr:MAG: response regulator [Campylobacterota bacterium]RLA65907.1 MAG: response regulator [Campylobacterota bacterium]